MKYCSFEGCERKHGAKGFCKVHYNMWKKGEALHTIGEKGRWGMKTFQRKCNFEGCNNPHRAKGWCSTHYNQFLKYGETQKPFSRIKRPTDNKCTVPNCTAPYKCHGYCQTHYFRWRANGTTDLIPRTVARKECLVDECETNKHNAGYCYRHYRELVLKIVCKQRGGHNKKPKVKCDVDNCDNFARVKGWCDKHYGRYRRNGDPLTCYRRPRKSEHISLDNIMKNKGTYSKADDAEILRENFSDLYNYYDQEESALDQSFLQQYQ